MSNMSYCRFQNTQSDLSDCRAALEELHDGDSRSLSESETAAAKRLANDCAAILSMLADVLGHEVIVKAPDGETDLEGGDWDDAINRLNVSADAQTGENDEDA